MSERPEDFTQRVDQALEDARRATARQWSGIHIASLEVHIATEPEPGDPLPGRVRRRWVLSLVLYVLCLALVNAPLWLDWLQPGLLEAFFDWPRYRPD